MARTRNDFVLVAEAAETWTAINGRRARELPGLRRRFLRGDVACDSDLAVAFGDLGSADLDSSALVRAFTGNHRFLRKSSDQRS